MAALLADGFTLLTEPMTLLPAATVPLDVTFGPHETVTVSDGHGGYLYRGNLPAPDGWRDAIDSSGRLAVVIASGLDLFDPSRDHLADLFTSIYEGTTVGTAVTVR